MYPQLKPWTKSLNTLNFKLLFSYLSNCSPSPNGFAQLSQKNIFFANISQAECEDISLTSPIDPSLIQITDVPVLGGSSQLASTEGHTHLQAMNGPLEGVPQAYLGPWLVGSFNPFEKIFVQMGSSSPIFGLKIKKYLKPPPKA